MTLLPPNRRSSGFTLVELLTVIAIIAVLIGILVPTINGALESAKRVQAKNDALAIVTAIKGYYTEYGKYPTLSSTPPEGDLQINSRDDNAKLMDILRSNVSRDKKLVEDMNPRKIRFLEAQDAKNLGKEAKERTGIGSKGQYLDPWGGADGYYRLVIDADYNNLVANPYSANAGTKGTPPDGGLSTGVIAWSLGRDGVGGKDDKNAGTAKDDVITWQ